MTRYATAYGSYEIDSLPGQPQIAHCHSLMVRRDMRGHGFGHKLKAHQMATLRALGYDMATCTVDISNTRQNAILERAGWSPLQDINNSRTGTVTQLWCWIVRSK